MAIITVNGKDVQIGDQEPLNLIQAAERAGVEVPHYCWHPALTVVASCRMCLVEVGDKKPDGTVAMQPRVVPACQTPAKHGTVVITDSKRAKEAQAATLEYLLLNHPLDCPVCDQAGECFLQDYSYKFGRSYSRLRDDKLVKPDKDHIGDNITLFTDRCVMCTRCVRFTREISGTSELQVINRGDHEEIDTFPGIPCNNKLAGNVVDICPVGALCSKDFLYKQRVWFLKEAKSVCPNCSTGCSVSVEENKNIAYRVSPRYNPEAQGHFMCDDGRLGYKYINSKQRLIGPVAKAQGNGDGRPTTWTEVLGHVRSALKKAAEDDPKSVAAVLSPWMTCEEAFLLAKFLKGLSKEARLFLGPVPVDGKDDLYPKGRRGEDPPPNLVRFTIRAEKCPNRKGVEAILRHYQGSVLGFDSALQQAAAGSIKTLYLVGGYREPWISEEQAEGLKTLPKLIVQDLLPSPASALAHFMLPAGSFAEKDGTFVNHAGLAQAIHRAIHSPSEAWPDGRILMELAERRGLFHPPSLRQELAKEVPYFACMASGELGEYGVRLADEKA